MTDDDLQAELLDHAHGRTPITFDVLGLPAPQGSKTRMPNGAMVEGKSAGQRTRHRDWRSAVAEAALVAADGRVPLTGALALTVHFHFPMPASRSKAIQRAGSNPKTSAPDLDKLIRSVGDALKIGGLIHDDALFTSIIATKTEVIGWTGATITVGLLGTGLTV